MADVNGKTVIITGASRGIGAAAAREFAAQGAYVMLTARSHDAIETIAAEINAAGGKAAHFAADAADFDATQALVKATKDTFGSIDIFIANAGMLDPVERLTEATQPDWDKIIDVNVKGVFYAMRAAVPEMKPNGGTFISIGSGAATSALEGWSAYCTSKAAVHHLNRCLHHEEADNGIRALVLSPGTVATEMQKVIAASGVNPVSQIPWENHIPPAWPAKTLVWMCGAEADGYLGGVVALREEEIRRKVGLIG